MPFRVRERDEFETFEICGILIWEWKFCRKKKKKKRKKRKKSRKRGMADLTKRKDDK